MKKIFISTGELSGDRLGAWYLKNHKAYCEATGGDFLKQSGAKIYEDIDKLSIVGVAEIVKHLPFILKFLKKLSLYIAHNNFDEVILVDYPGFNLMLAKRLKKLKPELEITYLSPPQLWVWGSWRVKKIKKYCDKVIVLYPFEVEWYKKHKINAIWLGYPLYDELAPYLNKKKENRIAVLPGSRHAESASLFPYFSKTISLLKKQYPDVEFILPLAESLQKSFIEKLIKKENLDIRIVTENKLEEISKCCLAISKPGTASLQLALLGVPTVLIYKASWLTYLVARLLVRVEYMGLANLLLKKGVSPELIQQDCTPEKIFLASSKIYQEYLHDSPAYQSHLHSLLKLNHLLEKKNDHVTPR